MRAWGIGAGGEGWRAWRERVPGPAGHLTAEEAAAFAGFWSSKPAREENDTLWRWPVGQLSGLVPEDWQLEGTFDAAAHRLTIWRGVPQ